MHAYEHSRRLRIDIGTEGEEDFIRVEVKPVNAKLGAALWSLYLGIAFGQSEDLERDAEAFGRMAVGEENWGVLDEELRWDEAQKIIHAAFFWNVQGGGIDLVNTLLEQDGAQGGYPKAQQDLADRNGISEAFGQLRTLLSSAAVTETPSPAATSDTSTPTGSES